MRSTLLIELERFEGVAVFATNFAKNYDSAFVSRIRYHIAFKLPDLEGRKQLWSKMLVPGVPLAEDRETLIERCATASEGLSGGKFGPFAHSLSPRHPRQRTGASRAMDALGICHRRRANGAPQCGETSPFRRW